MVVFRWSPGRPAGLLADGLYVAGTGGPATVL